MSSRRTPEERLRHVISEIRATEPPAPNLERMQARLLGEFRRAAAAGDLRARSAAPGRRAAAWFAAAAAILVGVGVAREIAFPESSPVVRGGSAGAEADGAAVDGSSLSAGTALEARADRSLTVEHAGHVTWQLARGSRARMLPSLSGVLRVELERGRLNASVVPGRAESFVVSASGTEVAVRGTRFEVMLDRDRVRVAVSAGEVEVRPADRSRRTAVTAGMTRHFVAGVPEPDGSEGAATEPSQTSSGGPGAPALESPAPPPSPQRQAASGEPRSSTVRSRRRAAAPASSSPRAVASAPAPPAPPHSVVEAAVARVTEHIEGCFRKHTEGRGAVSIQAATRLGLQVQPNGLILEVHLDPPLAPQVEHCVASELASVSLGESPSGFRVEREIRVSR